MEDTKKQQKGNCQENPILEEPEQLSFPETQLKQDDEDDDQNEQQKDNISELAPKLKKYQGPGHQHSKPVQISQHFTAPKSLSFAGGPPPMHHNFNQGSSSFRAAKISANNMFDPVGYDTYFEYVQKIDNSRIPVYQSGNSGVIFFGMHGAGHSALSFAVAAKHIKQQYNRFISYDMRGHGDHHCEDQSDLSQENLVADAIIVLQYIVKKYPSVSIVLIGHSLGGAIAAKVSYRVLTTHRKEHDEIAKHIHGIIIIDVCQGSATDALPHMENIVKSRPDEFKSLSSAIAYAYKTSQIRNLESARVSMPHQVIKNVDGQEGYKWRVDLLSSKKYWKSWFTGMNKAFLGTSIYKSVMLADRDRIDKQLVIAQHMGKFKPIFCQNQNVGHSVHEDDPKFTADTMINFIHSFKIQTNIATAKTIITPSGKTITIPPN